MGFLNKQKEKVKNKAKNKVKAKIKTKIMSSLIGVFLVKILPIILITSLVVSAVSWVIELVNGKNNPQKLYSNLENDNLNEIIAVSGNPLDGYYIGYKEGFDESLKKTVEEYEKAGYKGVTSKLLIKMIQAELYTQYPDFGGKIGKEVSVPEDKTKEEKEKEESANNKVNSLENFLFVGDSITVGMDNYIDVKHNTKAVIGVGSSYWLDRINEFPDKEQVKGINVFLGANDYDYGIENMKKLLLALHDKYPKVKIFVNKLLPDKNANTEKRNKYINEVKSFCKSHDSFLTFIDPTNDVEMSSDGLHPTEVGYKKLWENVKNKILENGSGAENEPELILGTDTGKGRKGFQGGIKIRRVTPDKEFGKMESPEGDEFEDLVKMSGEYIIEINNYLVKSGTPGEWNIYAKSLKGDKELAMLNSEKKQIAANFIDLFIAEVAYQEKEVDESLIESMIKENNTDATDKMIEKLGIDKINKYLKDNGYENTEINTKINKKEEGKENYTTAADVGKLLEKIYNNKFIDKEKSEKMAEYLKTHNDRKGIPEGITKKDKIKVGNKTGSKDLTQNDAGIIYLEDEPYILVMMGSYLENAELGKEDIKEVSKILYDKITKKEEGENEKNEEFVTKQGTSIRSKVYDMKYIPQEEFDKKIENNEEDVLQYYTLDGNWKLITAKWSYTDDVGLEFQKNSPIDYRTALKKYMTPFEYLMNYYIDVKDERFIQDFANLIMDSEFVISVQDNISTTSTHVTVSTVFNDKGYDDAGKFNKTDSYDKFEERVSTNIEITYADTWFVKFWKDIDYNTYFGNLYHGEYVSDKQKSIAVKARSGDVKKPTGKAKEEDWVEKVYIGEGYSINKKCCGAESSKEAKPTEHTDKKNIPVGAVIYGDFEKGKKCSKCKEKKPMVGIYVGDGEVASYSARRKRGVVDKLEDWIRDYGWTGWGWLPGTEGIVDENVELDLNKEIIMNLNGKVNDTHNPPTDAITEGESKYFTKSKVKVKHIQLSDGRYETTKDLDENGKEQIEKVKELVKSTVTTTTSSHTISNKYENGESHVSGNKNKFLKLFKDNPEALGALKARYLFDLMEQNERTAPMLDLTKYLLYCLDSDKFDFGVHEFDFSKYKIDSFNSVSRSSGKKLLKEYIRYWEHSSPPPTNADGTKYIIENDGAGNPVVGYGVDIFNGGFANLFQEAGYPTNIGGEVDIEFVDQLEEQEINQCMEYIKKQTESLGLKEYQINALVCRAYNCGNAGAVDYTRGSPKLNFVDSYQRYWNPETDDKFKEAEADYGNMLYTQYMSIPVTAQGAGYMAGLERRRKSEWRLFQTGYYDVIDKWHSDEVGGDIMECADYIHKYMEENQYTYCVYGGNSYEECGNYGKSHGLDSTFEKSQTGHKNTCCATYVSWVLQEAGYITEEEHNSNGLNGADNLSSFLERKGFEVINNVADLEPGDILSYPNHVEIYAGEGKVYNAGSGNAIRGASPATKYGLNSMRKALRAPN